jgi:hypothetical protein
MFSCLGPGDVWPLMQGLGVYNGQFCGGYPNRMDMKQKLVSHLCRSMLSLELYSHLTGRCLVDENVKLSPHAIPLE